MVTKLFFCKKSNETVTLKSDLNLFSRLLSVSREQDVDVQNVLSRELSVVPLDLLIFKWCCETYF